MRCRKVRSLLSAACSDELEVRQQAAVKDHLASCSSCRKEASYYTTVRQAVDQVPKKSVNQDFNARLLDRLAHERFQQTRTQAYLPRRAPRLSLRVLAPVAVTAALVLVAVSSFLSMDRSMPGGMPSAQLPSPMDDRYLTIQPTSGHNAALGMGNDWSLRRQLARSERLETVSRELTSHNGFGNMHLAGTTSPAGMMYTTASQNYPLRRPVFKVYRITGGSGDREDAQAY
jgi:hypothetical protein